MRVNIVNIPTSTGEFELSLLKVVIHKKKKGNEQLGFQGRTWVKLAL